MPDHHIDVGTLLDPELAPLIEAFPAFTLTPDVLPAMRDALVMAAVELSDRVTRTDHVVPGDPPIAVRVHVPVGASGPLPCVYSIHGGGMVLGSRDMDDPVFDRWCPELEVIGVSVEYRLAPETPYPGPLEDCYRALVWTFEHAADLGIDPAAIGVRGISAGGGLAAGLALLARDRGGPPLRFQLLDCPMLDDRQITPSSRLDGLAIWNRESNTFGWRSYLGDLYGTDDVPPYAAPARATDLAGLPPALVSVGGADGFRDEDVDYALRLSQAGVPTELHVYPGAPHGYHLIGEGAEIARRANRDMLEWLARQVARPGAG